MRTLVMMSAAAAISLFLVSCGKNDKGSIPVAADTEAAVTEVSAAEKAEVDALGSDLVKLAELVDKSTGAKQQYAVDELAAAFDKAKPTDVEEVNEAFSALEKSGKAKITGFAAKTRLAK